MKENRTELVFILDRSGSMAGLEDDTIGGFNGMLKKQQAQCESANVTTVLFDDKVEVIHDRFPIAAVKPLTEEDYYVRGCTALLDAVGDSIRRIENVEAHLAEEYQANKVIFVITTDGQENASSRFSFQQIKKMIEAKQEMGWEFLFLGANIDAAGEAEKIGIRRNRAVTYENDSKGVALNFDVLGDALCCAMSCDIAEEAPLFDDNWAERIEEYHKKKSQ